MVGKRENIEMRQYVVQIRQWMQNEKIDGETSEKKW